MAQGRKEINMEIKNVAIFGGNGTIGSLMGGLIAGFGKANVYLISRDKSKLDEKLLDKIYNSIKSDSIKNRLILCDYDDAKKILNKCDWVFESVAEDYNIKTSIYNLIDEYARKDAIITTGTSGLSIENLSKVFNTERKKYYFCTHFFNPPYHMNLCEIIPNKYSDKEIVRLFRKYLEDTLLRTTIVSKDRPAFIANRIGFKLMNELLILADRYKAKGGIAYIDSLFTGYTGRNMPPLSTIDFVGLDIHKAIVDNIFKNTEDEFKDDFVLPPWYDELIKNNILGNKSGKGLYKKDEKGVLVLDINSKKYINKQKYEWTDIQEIEELISIGEYTKAYRSLLNCKSEEKEIVTKVLVEYILYSIYISKFTAERIEDCDDAMATGFGWCPPIALKDLIDEVSNFEELCVKYVGDGILKKYDLYSTIRNIPKSKYDYKKYIKAI